jgi:hypothetical protein
VLAELDRNEAKARRPTEEAAAEREASELEFECERGVRREESNM